MAWPRRAAPVATIVNTTDETHLHLQISTPALLLNHMAERYSSTARILMEFVDNSLDDAETFFDQNANAYRRPIRIDILVSREDRKLSIIDDCRGMRPAVLSRVVMRVGESRKRGASFVNGQFGFGMQSFRAACSMLTVTSRCGEHEAGSSAARSTCDRALEDDLDASPRVTDAFRIRVERSQSAGFHLERLEPLEAPALLDAAGRPTYGTEVSARAHNSHHRPKPDSDAASLRR